MSRKSKSAGRIWRWVRHASANHEDAWRERLAFLGAGNLAVLGKPGVRMIRLEAYADGPGPLRSVAREFGGTVERVDVEALVASANAPRQPILIGRTLAVLDEHGEWTGKRPVPPHVLRIGGAMAFGTGDHATTASCLRLLLEEAAERRGAWTALDIGTGSGILALAAERLGAREIEAFDSDARAVRAARANARRNDCHRVAFERADITNWRPRKRRTVVMANLFSGLLTAAAPAIRRAVRPGGSVIVSGILRPQEKATLAALRGQGLRMERTLRRGKWVAILLRAPSV